MSNSYTPQPFLFGTGLDEVGIDVGMPRLKSESMADYRYRVFFQLRDPPDATTDGFIRTAGRMVAELDKKILSIDLVLNSDGSMPVSDPRIEVSSSRFRIWDDYENGSLVLDLDIREQGKDKLVDDVIKAVQAITWLSLDVLITGFEYSKSFRLKYGSTDRYYSSVALGAVKMNNVGVKYIKTISFSATPVFNSLEASLAALSENGDFYIDSDNGIVYSYQEARGFCHFSAREFPYELHWQSIRSFPLHDEDTERLYYDTLKNDATGEDEYAQLNTDGAKVYNELLEVHPLQWGK
jgi:hypothetical protein